MDYIKILREDKNLSELLCVICDVEIFPEFVVPQDEGGHLTYNICGRTFAREGNGSEYILLEDGSVGYWGSEGQGGRIADSLQEFFELMINCPYWTDYICEEAYQDEKSLREFAMEIFEEHKEEFLEDGVDLEVSQRELGNGLGIEIKADPVGILMRFYHCSKREPRFIQTFTEDDGSEHSGTGSIFEMEEDIF